MDRLKGKKVILVRGSRLTRIATECGMARSKTPQFVKKLLAIHAESSHEPKRAAHKRSA